MIEYYNTTLGLLAVLSRCRILV